MTRLSEALKRAAEQSYHRGADATARRHDRRRGAAGVAVFSGRDDARAGGAGARRRPLAPPPIAPQLNPLRFGAADLDKLMVSQAPRQA